jgi:hypothetical protein
VSPRHGSRREVDSRRRLPNAPLEIRNDNVHGRRSYAYP